MSGHVYRNAGIVAAALVLVVALGATTAQAGSEAARVIGVRGQALAQTPGEAPRVLHYDSAVFAGDRLVTSAGAGLGLLAGVHYVGLDESTTATLRMTDTGAPDLEVSVGRVRLLDSGGGAAARLATSGLRAVDAGTDTEAFAFPEKVGLISMICPNEGTVNTTRRGEQLAPGVGDCAVSKPGEALYVARAGNPPLEVLADSQGYPLAGDTGAPLPPVSLPLPAIAMVARVEPFRDDPRRPCDGIVCGDTRVSSSQAPPLNPTTNPPIGGGPPPAMDPTTNPPIGGGPPPGMNPSTNPPITGGPPGLP
jgi:hypothetical protein